MGKRPAAVVDRTAFRPSRIEVPRSDVFTAPPLDRQLPVWPTARCGQQFRPAWFFVAAHGGAGASLLARMTWEEYRYLSTAHDSAGRPLNPTFGFDAGQAWPNPTLEATGNVVVLCRTTMAGLARAREVAAQYLAGAVPNGLRVLGLMTIADQPGRLPHQLAAARAILAGVYAHTWHIPYVPEYRLFTGLPADPVPSQHPAVVDALDGIRSIVNPKGLL